MTDPTSDPESPSVGIDLGVTHSFVAVVTDGEAQVIPDRAGRKGIPSVVAAPEGRPLLVGEAARGFAMTNSLRWVGGPKRLLGCRFDSEVTRAIEQRLPIALERGHGDAILVQLGDRAFTLEEVAGLLLYDLREMAQTYLGSTVNTAVIATPSTYTDAQLDLVDMAARRAGFKSARHLDEASAAVLVHRRDITSGPHLVYHLGGATCTVSIVTVGDDGCEVLCTAADPFLGGADVDEKIVEVLLAETSLRDHPRLRRDPICRRRLLEAAEEAKIALSTLSQVFIDLPHLGIDSVESIHVQASLDRARLEQITVPLVDRSLDLCHMVLKQARLGRQQIRGVILEGGQTQMPRVYEAVAELFRQDPVLSPDPAETVARGAALSIVQQRCWTREKISSVGS